eukprot:2348098-Amphidinium_carterae.1
MPADMFCVSNRQAKHLILLICGGICFLLLAAMHPKTQKVSTSSQMDGIARARSAWYETRQQQNALFVASCVLLPLY